MPAEKTTARQNTGTVEDDLHEPQVVNAETLRPGSTRKTEGGVPEGTPPSAPPPGSLGRDVTPVEETE